ncbi:MAG: AbrB/MazE/SpoVT family DNA-binding domain-containing protein [Candidatus Gracilibacteria bacterium]|nr:AbrB/MazE/SpoVT family DNA-binding domain-containing protein [Candidatus Gracilibacteria bacterium]
MNYTLKSFNTGQVTLPKKWREQFHTKNFIATETKKGLLIQPIEDKTDSVYYENKQGFGIYSESGINPDDIIHKINSLHNG